MSALEQYASKAIISQAGQSGGKAITGTSAVTPASGTYFFALQAMADTAVAAQGDVPGADNPDFTAITAIPKGATVYGKFNSITLTSGEMIGYYMKE